MTTLKIKKGQKVTVQLEKVTCLDIDHVFYNERNNTIPSKDLKIEPFEDSVIVEKATTSNPNLRGQSQNFFDILYKKSRLAINKYNIVESK